MSEKEELSNMEIALFSLYQLGGATKKIHTELIAWEAYQLAPERFSWRLPEFRERGFPDKTAVRYALEQAKKKENNELVTGRGGGDVGGSELEGWTFTSRGVQWAKTNISKISEALEASVANIHPREVDRFLKKIKQEKAYEFFLEDGNLQRVTPYMFTDLLGCTPDASPEVISRKLERFLSVATLISDDNILHFLHKCKNEFASLFSKPGV